MSKDIIISIHKKYDALILSGEKTLEVRRSVPSGNAYPFNVYMYETSANNGAGALVGEFRCYGVTSLNLFDPGRAWPPRMESTLSVLCDIYARRSCLKVDELKAYAGRGKSGRLYFLNITNPRRYPEFFPLEVLGVYSAPQSWCYVNTISRPYLNE